MKFEVAHVVCSRGHRYLCVSWHWCLIIAFLFSLQNLSVGQTYKDLQKAEQYCRDTRSYAEGNKGLTRYFFLSTEEQTKSWTEQTKKDNGNNLYTHKDYTAAYVSIRQGRTIYVALESLFDISTFGGTDSGPVLLMPNRCLVGEYYFYQNGELAMVESNWSAKYDEGPVKRRKIFDEKGNLLLSVTEFTDDRNDKFIDKPKEDLMPQIYRRVSELPFYNLLQKPKPKK